MVHDANGIKKRKILQLFLSIGAGLRRVITIVWVKVKSLRDRFRASPAFEGWFSEMDRMKVEA